MQKIITKEGVLKAIQSLQAAGVTPTYEEIRRSLGNRGSQSTLSKYIREINADALAARDSQESLKRFREFWSMAVAEGRGQNEIELHQTRDGLDVLVIETERLERALLAATDRVAELEKQRDEMVANITHSHAQVVSARAAGERHATDAAKALGQLSSMQEIHAYELADLRKQLNNAQESAHGLELKLARAETRLEKKQDG